jgi:hypothetical protein
VKKNHVMVVLLAVVLAGWLGRVQAQDKAKSRNAENHEAYVLGTNGTLYLTLPDGWKGTATRVRGTDGQHDAFIFTPADTNEFNLMIVVFAVTRNHAGAGEMKNSLLQNGESILTNCVETSLTLHDLEGGEASGAYFRVTDRRLTTVKPTAGDFKYMTRGFAVLEPLVLTFDLDSNDADRDEPTVMRMLKEARFTP